MKTRGIFGGLVMLAMSAAGCSGPSGTGILVELGGNLPAFDALDVTARFEEQAETQRITDETRGQIQLPTSFVIALPARVATVQLTLSAKRQEVLVASVQSAALAIVPGQVLNLALALNDSSAPIESDAAPATDAGTANDAATDGAPAGDAGTATDASPANDAAPSPDAAPVIATWTAVPSPTSATINTVWAADAANVFIATSSTVYRYNDGAWNATPLALSQIVSLVGKSANDIYALGSPFTANTGIFHFDGNAWTPVVNSNCGNAINTWRSASVDSSGRMIFVGSQFQMTGYKFLYCELVGTTWTELVSGGGTGYSDVASVGGATYLTRDDAGFTVLHAVAGDPVPSSVGNTSWSRAWGKTPGALFFGGRDTQLNIASITWYTGTQWIRQNFPQSTGSVSDLSGSSANDVYATTATGQLLHFTGGWGEVTPLGNTSALSAVHVTNANDVWVVGANGVIYRFH